jgi:UTP--glucose-1-phosphate uridylyltransferase
MKVNKAIFPVAGLGTRFLPATKAQPKEMLPVVDKPLIQYAVEEAYAAGVREMIFVTGRHKRPIEDHFDMTFELEVALEQAGKQELLEVVRSVKPDDMECIYVRQAQALGLGHAVLCAQRLVGNEPFAVLLADDLMVGDSPVLKQMVEQYNEWRVSILAVQEVPAEHTRRYGIVAGSPINDHLMDVTRIVEKPAPEQAPSLLGVAGRYILTPGVFHEIANQQRGVGGEIQLTDGIAGLLRREKVFAYRYEGRRYDCGSKASCRPMWSWHWPTRNSGRASATFSERCRSELRGDAPRLIGTRCAEVLQRRRSTWMNSSATFDCSTSSFPVWRAKA